jgi:hypothetical protein
MKEPPACPQCKAKFSYLITYRHLDGTFSDFPVEESVCLLKRAHWFEEQCKVRFSELASTELLPIQLPKRLIVTHVFTTALVPFVC